MVTVGISLIHSCASLLKWRGTRLPQESHIYSRRLPALVWISSLWHSGLWAEITLCQHHFRPSQCFVLIQQAASRCPLQFWVNFSPHRESFEKHSLSVNCHWTWIHSTPRSVKQLPSSSNLETNTPEPNPQSQSLSRGYGSILPTSLSYFTLCTRGCQPWRPDFTSRLTLSPGNLISGKKVVQKKRQRFPKLPPALPNSFSLPYIFHVLVGEC